MAVSGIIGDNLEFNRVRSSTPDKMDQRVCKRTWMVPM